MIPKIKFRIYSGFYNDFLNCICENNIPVFNIQSEQLGIVAVCYASDYMKICRLRKRFQTKIKIISKTGIWFKIKYLFKRKGIFAGSLVFLALMYCFSLVIWDINIDVEDRALKNEIVCQLFNQGIYPGMIYSEEKLNNAESFILSANNKIRYISLNFYKGVIDCKISGEMTIADSISLEPVEYHFETEYDDIIEENCKKSENTLDIFQFLWENIVLEVPLQFTKVKDLSEFHGDGWKLISEDELKTSNNPFNDLLKDFEEE